MTRHRIDITPPLTEEAFFGQEVRQIEDTQKGSVSPENPPTREVAREPYLPDNKLLEAVNLAIALGRPLLLQGDPGCGKTRLAFAVAYALGLPLEECHVKSTARAQDLLYTYDAVNRLYDAQLGDKAPRDAAGNPTSSDPSNYVRLGPLGRAIVRAHHGRRSVVLIDEVDKADLDFPNDLLWELDRLEFQVAECPSMRYSAGDDPSMRPILFVTHNEEKALPTAFLRRCVYHYIELDEDPERLKQILLLHEVKDEKLALKAAEVLKRLRALDLTKKPSLSELIDWAGYLSAMNVAPEDLDTVPYRGALLKQAEDLQVVESAFGASSATGLRRP